MNGQNEGCKVGIVQFNGARRVGPNANASPVRRMLVVAWAISAISVLPDTVSAMEDVATGRWITRDPLYYDTPTSIRFKQHQPEPQLVGSIVGQKATSIGRLVTENLFGFLATNPNRWVDADGFEVGCPEGESRCICTYQCPNGASAMSSRCCPLRYPFGGSFGRPTCGGCPPAGSYPCDGGPAPDPLPCKACFF